MIGNDRLDDDYDDDDDDFYGEDEFMEDVNFFNALASTDITRELVTLTNRELLEFLIWHLSSLDFCGSSELELIGMEFNNQYILQFYNVREDKSIRVNTGSGNLYAFLDGWYKNTVTELYKERMYGPIEEMDDELRTDIWMNILLDVVQWKQSNGIPLLGERPSSDHEPSQPEDK